MTTLDEARAALQRHARGPAFVAALEAFEAAVRANERATPPTPTDPVIDRIPVARSIRYIVRGVPEVPDEYNEARTIAPTEITLTYRAAPDSQLGRVHAYVKGWWMQDGARVHAEAVGRHFHGDPARWPEWLAAEARLIEAEQPAGAPESHPDHERPSEAFLRAETVAARVQAIRDLADKADPPRPEISFFGDHGHVVGEWMRQQAEYEERRLAAEEAPDIAAADNPTPLRWGLGDVLWGDDDTVTVLLSGPGGEPYWLELDQERAAVLREDLAGPDGARDGAA